MFKFLQLITAQPETHWLGSKTREAALQIGSWTPPVQKTPGQKPQYQKLPAQKPPK